MYNVADDLSEMSNRRLLRRIRKVKGKRFYDGLIKCMSESRIVGKFELTRAAVGEYQDDYSIIKGIWVDQWKIVGGDDFEGNIYVKLKIGLFIKFYFEGY